MSSPHVSKKKWQEIVEGFEITGIAVRDRNVLQMLSRQHVPAAQASLMKDSDIPTRLSSIFLDDSTENNIECQQLSHMPFPSLGVSRAPFARPGGLVAAMNADGDTWPLGGGNGPLEKIATGQWPGTSRLKFIGAHTYAVGTAREIYKRVAVGRWEKVAGIETPRNEEEMKASGFDDIDGFSENDLYAVGGHGDVWHFNGREWRQSGFPTNERLATVTCAGDGNVYISSEGGSLWVGQHSTWRLLEKRESTVLWNDVRWFQGRLWLASDYQLRVWDGREIVVPQHEGKSIVASGHMDAHDGLLAVADLWTVSTFDGKTWRKVVAPYKD
ncbi:hypothetical protein ACFJIX_24345 [Roseateles sp. UC29_93]|uniref:hypothetical protein n=1 Tax=Roseateles sp. UC29_93 TaxID=3350177 RepID=UPI00366B0A74